MPGEASCRKRIVRCTRLMGATGLTPIRRVNHIPLLSLLRAAHNPHSVIQSNASAVFSAGVSGLIGLGTNTADFGDTVFSGWLSRNPAQPNFTFGLALNPLAGTQAQTPTPSGGDPNDASASASAGTLHMQQADPLSYTGEVQWQTVQNEVPVTTGSTNSPGVSLGASSWLIHMDGWVFTSAGAQTSNSQGGLAAVEPFFANIFLPQDQANQLCGLPFRAASLSWLTVPALLVSRCIVARISTTSSGLVRYRPVVLCSLRCRHHFRRFVFRARVYYP